MDGAVAQAVILTLKVAATATAVAVVPAYALAYALARKRFPGRAVISALSGLPLVVPPTALGFLLLKLLAADGPLGRNTLGFDPHVLLTWRGAVIATAVVSFPLIVRTARVTFEAVDPRYALVARTLGHSAVGAFFRYTLPLATRGLAAAAILGFTRALGEFGATIVIAGSIPGETQTLASAIFAAQQAGHDAEAYALVAIAFAVGLVAILAAELLLHEVEVVIELDVHLDQGNTQIRARLELGAQVTGLFGPSGAGKTSLLEVIAGLRPRARGSVRFDGETWWDTNDRVRVPPEKRGVGYVPQDDLLFPNLNVRRNLTASRRARGVAIDVIVQALDLKPLLERPVRDLSGGEKKRVAIGRALASQPRLLLLDEPFAALDARRREAAHRLIANARRPALVACHDAEDLLALCDEILLIDDGSVIAQGDPVRMLRGRAFDNLARGVVREVGGGLCIVDPEEEGAPPLHVRGDAEVGESVVVAARASDIIIARSAPEAISARNVFPAIIRKMNRIGDRHRVEARAGALRFDVAITEAARERLALDEGDDVHLIFKASACRLFRSAR